MFRLLRSTTLLAWYEERYADESAAPSLRSLGASS
jgi:hypothetical protein